MGRVKLKFPDNNPLFTTAIYVRIGDINFGGHVGNDAILSIIHEARVQMLRSHGYDELNAGGNSLCSHIRYPNFWEGMNSRFRR